MVSLQPEIEKEKKKKLMDGWIINEGLKFLFPFDFDFFSFW
jgi:hypothetical protein